MITCDSASWVQVLAELDPEADAELGLPDTVGQYHSIYPLEDVAQVGDVVNGPPALNGQTLLGGSEPYLRHCSQLLRYPQLALCAIMSPGPSHNPYQTRIMLWPQPCTSKCRVVFTGRRPGISGAGRAHAAAEGRVRRRRRGVCAPAHRPPASECCRSQDPSTAAAG